MFWKAHKYFPFLSLRAKRSIVVVQQTQMPCHPCHSYSTFNLLYIPFLSNILVVGSKNTSFFFFTGWVNFVWVKQLITFQEAQPSYTLNLNFQWLNSLMPFYYLIVQAYFPLYFCWGLYIVEVSMLHPMPRPIVKVFHAEIYAAPCTLALY